MFSMKKQIITQSEQLKIIILIQYNEKALYIKAHSGLFLEFTFKREKIVFN